VEEQAMTHVEPLPEGESLAVGAEGEHVQALQEMLQHLGYYQGQIDAQYGEMVEGAVREFQRMVGHQEDGQAGTDTWHELLHQVQQVMGSEEAPAEAAEEAVEAVEQAAIQVGQLSEDGAWQWDGTEWKAAGGTGQPAETQGDGAEHPPQDEFHSAIVASINVQAGGEA
jgi:peptidoglycan hydrolase-like protein with peptidoglycan-binding domain